MSIKDTILKTLGGAAAITCGMHCFNLLYNYQACSKKLLPKEEGLAYKWRGVTVYYEKHGKGSPLILIHSLHPAVCSYEWHLLVDELAKHHTVYLLDLPGCGRSAKPGVLYTNFYYVTLFCDFIRDLEIEKPILAASNSSAAIAAMLAGYEKDLIRGLVFVNPTSPEKMAETPNAASRIRYKALKPPFFGTFIYSVMSSRMQVDHTIIERYFYNPFHASDRLVDTYTESAHLRGGRGHFFTASLYGRFLNVNIEHALKSLRLPMLLIEGASTPDASATVEEWKALAPSIETVTIAHSKNLPMLEEPAQTASAILAFTGRQ